MKILINACLAVLLCFLAVNLNTKASTFTVDNLNDAGAGSLRQAITDSNVAAGADIINVNVTGSILLVTSLPTIIDNLTINGNSQNGLIVDCQNTSGLRAFSVNGTTVPGGFIVNINNLTVTRGNATNLGGGLRVEGGATLNITNVNVNANTSTGAGGLYATSAATLNVVNSRVTNNNAIGTGGDGGGISIAGATLFMSGTTVSGNVIPTSGGSTGGGVNIVANATNASLVRIENSTISGNTGEFGGGIYNSASSGSSTLKISNVTVSGNTSGSNGGGIFASGVAVIRNSTIAGNTANGAGAGGGIYATGTPTITLGNSIVADNSTATTPATSAEIRANGTFQTVGTNIIEGSSSGAITVLNGSNITGVDPQLTALANNGGLVFTQSFQTGSNARNAGANSESLNTSETPAALTTDARGAGFARITGQSVDVGAFEFGSVLTVVNRRAYDFDGNGFADISVFRPSEGNWFRLSNTDNSLTSTQFGLSSDKLVPADYDNDGRTDIAIYRGGVWFILQSSNSSLRIVSFGTSDDLPRPGDFDGDGAADLTVFRPSNGTWYRTNSSNGQFVDVQFGQQNDVPLIVNFDGDNKNDIAVWRPSNGVWYWLQSTNDNFQAAQFGLTGDIPVSGDFNNDGRSDLTVFRPSNATWYIARTTGIPAQNFDSVAFGQSTDKPVAADYDNDGRTDISVYRPLTSEWFIIRSSNAEVATVKFGVSSDIAVQTAYLP